MAALPVAAAVAEASSSSAAATGVTQHIIGGIPVYLDYAHHLQTVPNTHPAPFLLRSYIDHHAKAGQQGYVYKDGCQFQLQLRAGPLAMSFYHVQGGEAWIYVMSGAAQLRVISERDVQQLSLPTGMCYLVPGNSPYSLQCISAETRVLIMTRQRKTDSSYPNYNKTHVSPHLANLNKNAVEPLDPQDQMLWMCGKCGAVAHKKSFECVDYNVQSEALDAEFAAAVAAGSISCAACSVPFTAESLAHASASYTSLPASAPAFPVVNPDTHMPPYHLLSWVDTHRHLLAPPVGNKMIHGACTQFKVMIVGGPNQRTDYHINDGEEWFLMLEGDMTLKIVDGAVFRDVHIREGESFLLPPCVPHSPQRGAGTIGLVIERDRFTHELDGLRWYCPNAACRQVLTTFAFKCGDLGTQLKTLIGHWYDTSDEAVKRRTCNKCGAVETKPGSLAEVKVFTH